MMSRSDSKISQSLVINIKMILAQYLHIRQSPEGTEQSHGLSGARWSTQHQRFVLC